MTYGRWEGGIIREAGNIGKSKLYISSGNNIVQPEKQVGFIILMVTHETLSRKPKGR